MQAVWRFTMNARMLSIFAPNVNSHIVAAKGAGFVEDVIIVVLGGPIQTEIVIQADFLNFFKSHKAAFSGVNDSAKDQYQLFLRYVAWQQR